MRYNNMSNIINNLFKPEELPSNIGLHIKVRDYNGKSYIWFISPILRNGHNKIRYIKGNSHSNNTYCQNIRQWLWANIFFNRDSSYMHNGIEYSNEGRKWSKNNKIHTNFFPVKNTEIDIALTGLLKIGGIPIDHKRYIKFSENQIKVKSPRAMLPNQKDVNVDLIARLDMLEKKVDDLERVIAGYKTKVQLFDTIKLLTSTDEIIRDEVNKTDAIDLIDTEPEPVAKDWIPISDMTVIGDTVSNITYETSEESEEREPVEVIIEKPKLLNKVSLGRTLGVVKILLDDMEVEPVTYDIIATKVEDEYWISDNGDIVGKMLPHLDPKAPDEFKDKDGQLVNQDGGEPHYLVRLTSGECFFEVEYKPDVGVLQDTNILDVIWNDS